MTRSLIIGKPQIDQHITQEVARFQKRLQALVRTCINPGCAQPFLSSDLRMHACSPQCAADKSRRNRLDYYHRTGRKVRSQRTQTAKRAKRAKAINNNTTPQ